MELRLWFSVYIRYMRQAIASIRASLEALVPVLPPAGPAWSTGVAELDAALGGGIPRGRLTELVGPRASGRTTLARRVVAQVLSAGRWVAVIDATRTLAAQHWAGLGARLIVIRPRDPGRAAWCADRLLRSGVFGLVMLDGAPVLPRPITFRLSQLARDRDVALLVLGVGATATTGGGGGVRLRVVAPVSSPAAALQLVRSLRPAPPSIRRGTRAVRAATAAPCTVVVDKGAAPAQVEVPRVVAITVRLVRTGGADRRGGKSRRS